jgi:hypothetical protein
VRDFTLSHAGADLSADKGLCSPVVRYEVWFRYLTEGEHMLIRNVIMHLLPLRA